MIENVFQWYTRGTSFPFNTLEIIQALFAQNDKENGVDFYNSVFRGEAKMCFGFMSLRAPSAALKQKNYHNSPYMQPSII